MDPQQYRELQQLPFPPWDSVVREGYWTITADVVLLSFIDVNIDGEASAGGAYGASKGDKPLSWSEIAQQMNGIVGRGQILPYTQSNCKVRWQEVLSKTIQQDLNIWKGLFSHNKKSHQTIRMVDYRAWTQREEELLRENLGANFIGGLSNSGRSWAEIAGILNHLPNSQKRPLLLVHNEFSVAKYYFYHLAPRLVLCQRKVGFHGFLDTSPWLNHIAKKIKLLELKPSNMMTVP